MSRFKSLLPAGLIVLAFLALRFAGGREATQVISGTAVSREVALLGAAYVVAHLAAVIVAPILAIATAIVGVERLLTRRWPGDSHI
mgnify:CR=1 FL=1|jgi:hypothetical protein